jgi:hypothetical protein
MPQGLAMYESLRRHSSVDITLHVLALDADSAKALEAMKLPDVEVDANLFRPKAGQTWQEFCWSMASQYSKFLLNSLPGSLPEIVYCDADIFWFADSENIFREMGDCSIGITPHRLIPSKQHLIVNGKYNVGVVVFKNTEPGRKCLSKWAADVRSKCSATDGCGDQKYLDSWCCDYGAEVCELSIGINVAPWNVANWNVTSAEKLLGIPLAFRPTVNVNGVPLVCYHFHEYIHGERLTNYELRQEDRDLIYAPYVHAVGRAIERIAGVQTERQWETA